MFLLGGRNKAIWSDLDLILQIDAVPAKEIDLDRSNEPEPWLNMFLRVFSSYPIAFGLPATVPRHVPWRIPLQKKSHEINPRIVKNAHQILKNQTKSRENIGLGCPAGSWARFWSHLGAQGYAWQQKMVRWPSLATPKGRPEGPKSSQNY